MKNAGNALLFAQLQKNSNGTTYMQLNVHTFHDFRKISTLCIRALSHSLREDL